MYSQKDIEVKFEYGVLSIKMPNRKALFTSLKKQCKSSLSSLNESKEILIAFTAAVFIGAIFHTLIDSVFCKIIQVFST